MITSKSLQNHLEIHTKYGRSENEKIARRPWNIRKKSNEKIMTSAERRTGWGINLKKDVLILRLELSGHFITFCFFLLLLYVINTCGRFVETNIYT